MLPGKKYTAHDFLAIARRRVWLLVCPPLVATFVALMISASLTNQYQASVLVQIVPQRVPDAFVRSTVTVKVEDRLDAVIQQVVSRPQLEQVIRDFDLYPEERAQVTMQDVVDSMRGQVAVDLVRPRRNEPPGAFHVRFTYRDAVLSARVAERLGSLFIHQNARDRGALAEATDEFLDSQLVEARQRLEAQERRLEVFRQQHAGRLPSQLGQNMQAIQTMQVTLQGLVESLARDRDRKLMLERLFEGAAAEPTPVAATAVAGAPVDTIAVSGSARERLSLARQTLTRLEARLRPAHPDVVRARRAVTELEAQAAAEEASPTASVQAAPALPAPVSPDALARRERLRQMRAEIESLERQIRFKESEQGQLQQSIAQYQARIESVPAIESEWVALTRDYDTLQAAYKDLLSKSEASKIAAALERRQIGEQFRILERASVPSRPTSPVRLQINAVGFGIGLVLTLALVVLLELRDTSFRTESDIQTVLGLPVLALVPYVETAAARTRQQRRAWAMRAAGVVSVTAAGYVFWALRLWNHFV